MLVGDLDPVEPGQRMVETTRIEIPDPIEHLRTGPEQEVGFRQHQRERAGVLERPDHAGGWRIEGFDLEVRAEGLEQIGGRIEPTHQSMDRSDAELRLGQFDDETHHGIGRGACAVGPAHPIPMGQRGLIPMVTIGDDDGMGLDGGADRRDALRIGDHPDGVGDTIGDELHRRRTLRFEQFGEADGGGEPPDRREVGVSGAEQIETVALRLRGRVLMAEDLALAGGAQAQGADDTRGVPLCTVLVDRRHPMDGERRELVGDEHVIAPPLRQSSRGVGVGVDTRLIGIGHRKIDQRHVVRGTGDERTPILG